MGEAKRRAQQQKAYERVSRPIKPARFDLYALGARTSLTRVMSRELTHWSDNDEQVLGVDVSAGQTSVFVVRGRVAVGDRGETKPVLLGAGQGVDVVTGRPLEVKTWGRQRAANLLARFGR